MEDSPGLRTTEVERPVLREDAERVGRELKAAFASGRRRVVVDVLDHGYGLERVSDHELAVREPAEAAGARIFIGDEPRPAGYPDDLPYVPGVVVFLVEHDGIATGTWWFPRDLERLVQDVSSQCTASGWRREEGPVAEGEVAGYLFRKGDRVRQVITGPGLVSFLQRPSGSPGNA